MGRGSGPFWGSHIAPRGHSCPWLTGRAGPAPTLQTAACLSSEEEWGWGVVKPFPKVCRNKDVPKIFLPLLNPSGSTLSPTTPSHQPPASQTWSWPSHLQALSQCGLPPGMPGPSPQSIQVPSLSGPMPSPTLRVPTLVLTPVSNAEALGI